MIAKLINERVVYIKDIPTGMRDHVTDLTICIGYVAKKGEGGLANNLVLDGIIIPFIIEALNKELKKDHNES